MKKIFYLTIAGLIVWSLPADAQTTKLTGAQILRSARGIYDQGRLHELPAFLEEHLADIDNDVERVEAYKILVLTFIYLEEPEKADAAMLQILGTDFFFKPADSDPVEFKNLYGKFRVKPIFSYGAKVGVAATTFVKPKANHYVNGESRGRGQYNSNLTIQFTGIFEKELTANIGAKKFDFTVNPELSYTSQSFNYFNDAISFNDGSEPAFADHRIQHTRIQLNALVQYKILKDNKFNPYVSVGPSLGYLMKSTFDGNLTYELGNGATQSGLDNTASYKKMNYSVIASGGVKYKLSGIYLTLDVRYQFGLGNVVDEANRYKFEGDRNTIYTEYGYTDNDFSIDQVIFNLGLIVPKFNPKKLIK